MGDESPHRNYNQDRPGGSPAIRIRSLASGIPLQTVANLTWLTIFLSYSGPERIYETFSQLTSYYIQVRTVGYYGAVATDSE